MQRMIYLPDVVTLELNQDQCVGCGLCLQVCPHQVLAMNGKKAFVQERDACMECGACMRNCPSGALQVQSGVGCAQAVINSALGRESSACCCSIEPRSDQPQPQTEIGSNRRPTCC